MTSIKEITKNLIEFRDQRKWQPFHTPKNLALSLIVEIGELFELLQWETDEELLTNKENMKTELEDEFADVAIYLFVLAHEMGINLDSAIPKKMKKNALKYPK